MKISEITSELKNRQKSIQERNLKDIARNITGILNTKRMKKASAFFHPYGFMLFFPLSIIYMEMVFKISVLKTLFDSGLFYMFLFSVPAGLLIYILSGFFTDKINRIVSISLIAAISLIYIVQVVYYQIFTTFFALFSINGAGQVLQFWHEILTAIAKNAVAIVFLLFPLLFLVIYGREVLPARKTARRHKIIVAGIALLIQLLATLFVRAADGGVLSTNFLYSESVIPDLSVGRFGLLTTTRLDVKHLVFGFEDETGLPDEGWTEEPSKAEPSPSGNTALSQTSTNDRVAESSGTEELPKAAGNINNVETSAERSGYNIINIDFDKLIANETDPEILEMHKFFKNVEPTKKNRYTGMYKGKNLIMITAEGFSPYAVNKDVTPTLYKMAQVGFRFTNFYTPIWGVSTSDGEYVACNSLIPKSGVWSFYVSGRNYMPFCLGNQLGKSGYGTRAYHNHTYTYYHREASHPNMGYIYKAVGNGLDMTKSWPESDLEMIQKTSGEYLGSTPFHTYYMTVSGHLRYTFEGNAMAAKNKELVRDLPYSEHVKAYLACNIELDRAMGELISRLEKAGVAEDTLIAISPDHYPYGLTNQEIGELAGHAVESNFELYKGIFILWSKGMTPVTVDKPCSSMDILPTLSNLLGIEYDSRLLMGRDIFSDAPPLVVFSNWSWLTDKARYNSKQRKLIPADGETVNKKYTAEITRQVNNKFTYSTKILDNDYYGKVFK